ncbi:MAG: hacA 1, partial [Bacteroidetes bacterium]|nr:hacA 1 [Bacteroidota bacterium]
ICGENFGCGSSREHPAVGLVYAGIRAVLVKSVSRIFFRSAVNQGLPILVVPDAVNAYTSGDAVQTDMAAGRITIGSREFHFRPLPDKLLQILNQGGLVNWIAK